MISQDFAKVVPLVITDWYYTPDDLTIFESVLESAMASLERTGTFDVKADTRRTVQLRLAAAIMRRARSGERDPDTLRRLAMQSIG